MEQAIRKTAAGYDIDIMNFGTIQLSEFKMKYNSSAEVPTHLISLTNQGSGLIGHLAINADLRPDERLYDLNTASMLVSGHLNNVVNSIMNPSAWAANRGTFRQNRRETLIEAHRFGHETGVHGDVGFRTQGAQAAWVTANLNNSVFFQTEVEQRPGRHYNQVAKFCGTCKVFGVQTRFNLITPVVPLEWLNLDNIIQEVKDVLGARLGNVDILTEVQFYDELPQLENIPVPVTFPATEQ